MIDKSEKFDWLVRLGFAARGLVYALFGYMLLTGSDSGQTESGASDVFLRIQEVPLGTPILYLCALGLLAYGLYRFASLVFDIENYGSDKTGIGKRIGHSSSGLVHFVLAYTAFQFAQFAQGAKQSGGGGQPAEAANTVLSFELGAILLGLVGLGFLLGALEQAKKAIVGDFMFRISSRAPGFVAWLGRAGFAARTVVFAIIGWSLIQSAWFSNSSQVMSLGRAVNSLRDNGSIFTIVALGLLLFGIFSLFLARYRVIPDLDPHGRMPWFRSG